MPFEFNTSDFSTIISTVIDIFLWIITWRTLKVLSRQVSHQIANGYSSAQHQIVDAHRSAIAFQLMSVIFESR